MAVSTAPPSSLFSTCWVFPVKGKCTAWSSQWTLCCPVSFLISTQKSSHRFLYNLGARSTALSVASRSRFCPTTTSVALSQLYPSAPTTRGASIRSFIRSGTDRPFRPICSSPSADFPTRCVRFPYNQLALRLPLLDAVCTLLRNQIVEARSPRAPRRCSPLAVIA